MGAAECGRTMPAIGWVSPIQTVPSMAATARLLPPAPDPRMRGRPRRGTIRLRELMQAKPVVGVVSASRGRPAARVRAATAPPEPLAEAAPIAPARHSGPAADTARAHRTAAAADTAPARRTAEAAARPAIDPPQLTGVEAHTAPARLIVAVAWAIQAAAASTAVVAAPPMVAEVAAASTAAAAAALTAAVTANASLMMFRWGRRSF
jgi:hypothetical protein